MTLYDPQGNELNAPPPEGLVAIQPGDATLIIASAIAYVNFFENGTIDERANARTTLIQSVKRAFDRAVPYDPPADASEVVDL